MKSIAICIFIILVGIASILTGVYLIDTQSGKIIVGVFGGAAIAQGSTMLGYDLFLLKSYRKSG